MVAYVWVVCVVLYSCLMHTIQHYNGTGRKAATMAAPLLITSDPARCEVVHHNIYKATLLDNHSEKKTIQEAHLFDLSIDLLEFQVSDVKRRLHLCVRVTIALR